MKKGCASEDLPYYRNYTSIFSYSGIGSKWYLFTIKIDPFERKINFLVDGQNVASYPLAGNESLPNGFGLGCYVSQENDFQGYIDYVKLYTSDEY